MIDLHEGKRPTGQELQRRRLQEGLPPEATKKSEAKPKEASNSKGQRVFATNL
jgi:hypothetical protein